MVLSKFHSEDNVILQISADAPVFFRLHFSSCLDLRGKGGGLKVGYVQATRLYSGVGVVHQVGVVTVNYINHDLQDKSPFIS